MMESLYPGIALQPKSSETIQIKNILKAATYQCLTFKYIIFLIYYSIEMQPFCNFYHLISRT